MGNTQPLAPAYPLALATATSLLLLGTGWLLIVTPDLAAVVTRDGAHAERRVIDVEVRS